MYTRSPGPVNMKLSRTQRTIKNLIRHRLSEIIFFYYRAGEIRLKKQNIIINFRSRTIQEASGVYTVTIIRYFFFFFLRFRCVYCLAEGPTVFFFQNRFFGINLRISMRWHKP